MAPLKGRFDGVTERELVRWAAEYLRGQAEMLERSHTDEHGRIKPAETRIELKFIRDWVKRAAELHPPLTLTELATSHPAPTWPHDPRQPQRDPRQPQPDPREKRPEPTPAPPAA